MLPLQPISAVPCICLRESMEAEALPSLEHLAGEFEPTESHTSHIALPSSTLALPLTVIAAMPCGHLSYSYWFSSQTESILGDFANIWTKRTS